MNGSSRRLAELESRIARRFGRRFAVLTGSGTAALYCIFRTLSSAKRRQVVFPDMTCETAVNAAIFAGCSPRFSDIDLEDGTMSGALLERVDLDEIAAIVPTHIYGHVMDLSRLDSALDPSIPRVEDAAQGYGGSGAGQMVGSMGRASAISFGSGKLLDCGSGGAVLTDDEGIEEQCRAYSRQLPSTRDAVRDERQSVMKGMMAAMRGWRQDRDRPKLVSDQRSVLQRHRNGYLWQIDADTMAGIDTRIDGIEAEAKRRREFAHALDEVLSRVDGVSLLRRSHDAAIWRYSFLVRPQMRDPLHSMLREAGVGASRLFPPCSEKFSAHPPESSDSRAFARRVLNINVPPVGQEHSQVALVRRIVDQSSALAVAGRG